MPPIGSPVKRKDDKGKQKGRVKDRPAAAMDQAPPPPPMPGDDFSLPTREYVRPGNQMFLTDAEMEEELAKMLTANNPIAPKNIVRFNMKERCYKFGPMVEQLVCHYGSDGWLLQKSSEEARKQTEADRAEAEGAARFQAEVDRALKEKEAGMDVELPDDSRQLRNQFNFGERAAQTFTYPLRDRATMTEPPPTATISGSCSTWEIFDEYNRDFERQRLEEASKQKSGKKAAAAGGSGPAGAGAGSGQSNAASSSGGDPLQHHGVAQSLQILERMVNQNTFEDIAMDFKYWDDTSDSLRPNEGSLLPLWQFKCEAGRKHVTSICWSPVYTDMFAVGYGSYHSQRQGTGLVSVCSMKNPSHPERSITTDSGVMALHFHPEFANLLAVGCYDGRVLVFDVRAKGDAPLYASDIKIGKHSDPVWQVVWQVDELQKVLQFVSVSTDGEVLLWTLAKSELQREQLMRLNCPPGLALPGVSREAAADVDPAEARNVLGGLCMDFSKAVNEDHIYLVGTEEGTVHRCSKAYGSDFLSTYQGHTMPVYSVRWNALHPRMFLSASADWSVKLWDAQQERGPLMSFDLGDAVGDVAWAPFSATVFAAATDDGKVHVFDLSENRLLPLCSQKVSKKARLTKVVFNPRYPILLVGDSKGNVAALKLSPNLRRCAPLVADKSGAAPKREEAERARLDAVVEVARKSQAAGAAH